MTDYLAIRAWQSTHVRLHPSTGLRVLRCFREGRVLTAHRQADRSYGSTCQMEEPLPPDASDSRTGRMASNLLP